MTVSANSVKEFTRRELLRRALQKAGQLNAAQNPGDTDPRVGQAADALELVLSQLQSEGVVISSIEWQTLSLTAGQATTTAYSLPAATLDVTGTAMLIQGDGAGELPVEPMGAEDWQRMTDKTSTGVPTRYYVHRLLSVQIYLWPGLATDSSGWTLRYRQVRLLRGADAGGVTMDLARFWQLYLVYAVAHELAVDAGLPTERCAYLRAERDRLRKSAMGYNNPRGPIQMRAQHRGPWA